MDAQTLISVGSTALAACFAGVSVVYSQRATRQAERSAQHLYEDNMRVWAECRIEATGGLLELLSNGTSEAEFDRRRSPLLGTLRCQIDKGRWYFPNLHHERKGQSKPLAYRGIRQKVLDVLVA